MKVKKTIMFLKPHCNAILIVILALAGGADFSLASTCCAGGGGQSICVLPAEQHYQLGFSNTYRTVEGEYDPYGYYSSNSNGNTIDQIVTVFGGAYRINDEWQLGISVPFTTNQQKISGTSKQASAMGDPALEARFLFWEDLAFLTRPQLDFYFGLRLPLGTSVYTTSDPYALDAVGDGTTTVHIGANVSKLYRPFKFTFDGAYFHPVSRNVDEIRGKSVSEPYQLKLGNRFQFSESLAYLFNERWSSAVGLRQLWVLQSSINGNEADSSAQRLYTSLASVSYSHDISWNVALSAETVYPFGEFAANQSNSQSVSLALTYGGL